MRIAIIDYGAGNTQSVKYALKRLGCKGILTYDKEVISNSDKIIFPGVGPASSAMKKLKSKGLDVLIPNLKQPVLGICLGMQILYEYSEEGMSEGLGLMKGRVVKKVPSNIDRFKVPNVGWLSVERKKTSILFQNINNEDSIFYLM